MSLLTRMKYSFFSLGMDKETFTVVSFKGFEAISKPYQFEILLISETTDIDPLNVLQNPAIFTIHRDEEEDVEFNGILMQFEETMEFDGCLFFKAVLAPKLWWLSLTHHNQVFLNLSVPDIMETALKDGGLKSGIDFSFHLKNTYPSLEYVCQYDESHFNFVSRWAEREGIYYFFEQTPSGEKIIFTDDKLEHKDLLLGTDLIYQPKSGLDSLHTKEVIKNFFCRHNMLPQRVYLKDYNYLKPSLAVEGIADVDENGRGENYIYGEHFDTVKEGNRLAKIRAEALLCRKSIFYGESSVPFVVPGYTFNLNDHYKDIYNRKYLVIDVTHEGHQTGYLVSGLSAAVEKKDEQMFYSNTFTAVYSDKQFRPEHLTKKPKISGTINAKIDAAASGEHAELDEHGRYKVIVPFDRSGRFSGKASAWIRMIQPSAGQSRGMHFPLHKGTEVLLTFIEGNPDRPVIAGAIPNPETSSPITNDNQTKSVISTGKTTVEHSVGAKEAYGIDSAGTWKKQETDNFIEFEDATASRRIRLHSKGNLWFEAQNRYGEYRTFRSNNTYSAGTEPKITNLLNNFDAPDPKYNPIGMHDRHYKTGQINFHNHVFMNAHVHVSSMDTVTTQEGNIYDFGGYWKYNLGNSYIENHLLHRPFKHPLRPIEPDQVNYPLNNPELFQAAKAQYKADKEKYDFEMEKFNDVRIKNRAVLNKDSIEYDLLDKGGPDWTKIDWSKARRKNALDADKGFYLEDPLDEGSTIEFGNPDDIRIGSFEDQWDNDSNNGGIWVEKKFGEAYRYTEGDSIEVRNGSTFNVKHGGKHVDLAYFESGEIRSWTWDKDGASETREWNASGALIKKVESWITDGVTTEVNYNLYPFDNTNPNKISETRQDDTTGTTDETSYCRDTGNVIAFSSKHQGANSTHSFDFNWANTASASIDFAAGAAFSLNMSEKISTNIDISAVQSLNIGLSSDIQLNFKSGFNASFNFPIGQLPLFSYELDLSSLKIETDITGTALSIMGFEVKKWESGVKLEDEKELEIKNMQLSIQKLSARIINMKAILHI